MSNKLGKLYILIDSQFQDIMLMLNRNMICLTGTKYEYILK